MASIPDAPVATVAPIGSADTALDGIKARIGQSNPPVPIPAAAIVTTTPISAATPLDRQAATQSPAARHSYQACQADD